jgi:hypothetical protein
VAVNFWHCPWSVQFFGAFDAPQVLERAIERVKEFDRSGRKVHHKVVDPSFWWYFWSARGCKRIHSPLTLEFCPLLGGHEGRHVCERSFCDFTQHLSDECPTIYGCNTDALGNLEQELDQGRNGGKQRRTLLVVQFCCIYLVLLGFKSLANTMQPFLAAGTAKGPTPAKTSATTSDGSKGLTSLSCSI